MHFQHSPELWNDYPDLVPGVIHVEGITEGALVASRTEPFTRIAGERLANGTESELPEIQAWRRTFSRMGLKPTQYRCASEALLRRFRKEGSLPQVHPLIDLCNAISLAFAIPIAVFDLAHVTGSLEVRHASGDERYATFSGDMEHPEPREVIFADDAGNAHARRWTNRQSGVSAIRDTSSDVLIVAEALHATAAEDMARLVATLSDEIDAIWHATPDSALLSASSPRFETGVQRASGVT
jgi:DNA/RNA-binding domain of Phe-tRNA-synthetase-like protein